MESGRYAEENKFLNGYLNYVFIIPLIMFLIFYYYTPDIEPSNDIFPLIIVTITLAFIPLMFGKMTTIVQYDNLIVSFGYIGLIKKEIALSNIQESEIVDFNPLKQFGGWGIKIGKYNDKKTLLFALSGDKGFLVKLKEQIRYYGRGVDQIIIGSKQPEKLYEAIQPY